MRIGDRVKVTGCRDGLKDMRGCVGKVVSVQGVEVRVLLDGEWNGRWFLADELTVINGREDA